MWSLWNMAKSYSCRASELLGVQEPLVAFYVDRAVAAFGSLVDKEIEEAKNRKGSDAQRQMRVSMVIHRRLGAGSFASPPR